MQRQRQKQRKRLEMVQGAVECRLQTFGNSRLDKQNRESNLLELEGSQAGGSGKGGV